MTTAAIIKSASVWLVLLILAIANGVVREKLLVPQLGQEQALPASGIILSTVIIIVSLVTFPLLGVTSSFQAWCVGMMWLSLTVAFEFLFGHFVSGESWRQLLEAYNVSSGNLWTLVLIVTAFSPYFAWRVRGPF